MLSWLLSQLAVETAAALADTPGGPNITHTPSHAAVHAGAVAVKAPDLAILTP